MNSQLSFIVLIILILNVILSLYLLCSRNATKDMDNFAAPIQNKITDSKDYENLSLMLVDSDGNISTNKITLGEVAMVNKTNYFTQPQVFDVVDDPTSRASNTGRNKRAIVVNSGFVEIAKGDLKFTAWKQGTDLAKDNGTGTLQLTPAVGAAAQGKEQEIVMEHGHIKVKNTAAAQTANAGAKAGYIETEKISSLGSITDGTKKIWDIGRTGTIDTNTNISAKGNITTNANISADVNISAKGNITTNTGSISTNTGEIKVATKGNIFTNNGSVYVGADQGARMVSHSSGRGDAGIICNAGITGFISDDRGRLLYIKQSQFKSQDAWGKVCAYWGDGVNTMGRGTNAENGKNERCVRLLRSDDAYIMQGYAFNNNEATPANKNVWLSEAGGERTVGGGTGKLDAAEWWGSQDRAMRFRLVVAGEVNANGDAAAAKGAGWGTKR